MINKAFTIAEYIIDKANAADARIHEVTEILHNGCGWRIVASLEWNVADLAKDAYRLRVYERLIATLNCVLESSTSDGAALPTREQNIAAWRQDTVQEIKKVAWENATRCMGWSTSPSNRFTHLAYTEVLAELVDPQFGVINYINTTMGDTDKCA